MHMHRIAQVGESRTSPTHHLTVSGLQRLDDLISPLVDSLPVTEVPLDNSSQAGNRTLAQGQEGGLVPPRESMQLAALDVREERADEAGGVMHCFTEDWDIARQALDIGFYISMSGIVSFKNATIVHDVARRVPADRLLIETDSPYLAPVPYRGKTNQPGWVAHVAAAVARLRQIPVEEVGRITTENYDRLFGRARLPAVQPAPTA